MDLAVTLDPANARWTPGAVEYINVEIDRSDDAEELAGASYDLCLGAYESPDPDAWFPAATTEPIDVDGRVVVATLLIGGAYRPTLTADVVTEYWVWVRLRDAPEVAPRRCSNVRLRFPVDCWLPAPPVGGDYDGGSAVPGTGSGADLDGGSSSFTSSDFVDGGLAA